MSKTVLVVDDDLRLRDLLKRYLTEQGFAGFEAFSWVGLFVTGRTPPDVVQKLVKLGFSVAVESGAGDAAHCSDDSPFFVSIWYPLGILLVAVAGALAGARLLRW